MIGFRGYRTVNNLVGKRAYSLGSTKTHELGLAMANCGVRRGFVIWDPAISAIRASHACLSPVADFLSADDIDSDQHEGVFLQAQPDGTLFGAFIWRTLRGQGCGGIRLRSYNDAEAYIRDGLRLATGMGRKSALAGLWWGGGKGVIAKSSPQAFEAGSEERIALLHDYGEFLTSLRGCYVAAEDAGIAVEDVDQVFSRTRFTTCISPELGGSGNPSVPTAAGVVAGMRGALSMTGETLAGKRVAVQGLGNVGLPLVGFLLEQGVASIIGSDVSAERVGEASALYPGQETRFYVAGADGEADILEAEVDILSPNAFGGILHAGSVPQLRCRIVCGAANNQMLDPADDGGMCDRGIMYVPDFVTNRMGIVNCANEQYGRIGALGSSEDPLVQLHLGDDDPASIYNTVRAVVTEAREHGIRPEQAADRLADEAAAQPHPIFGHRSQAIIKSLVSGNWAD